MNIKGSFLVLPLSINLQVYRHTVVLAQTWRRSCFFLLSPSMLLQFEQPILRQPVKYASLPAFVPNEYSHEKLRNLPIHQRFPDQGMGSLTFG
jgi:hypothetical protein